MLISFFFLAVGILCLIKGADLLVDGGASLAKKIGVSNLTIGLTVVAFGTSMPEMVVNVFSALNGVAGVSVGNIIGSNVTNLLLVLGLSALVFPLSLKRQVIRRQALFSLFAAVLLMVLFNIGGILSLFDGIILLACFTLFFIYSWKNRKEVDEKELDTKQWGIWSTIFIAASGSILLFFGGRWTINSVMSLLQQFNLSEILISSTLLAIGTSLPELAASLAAVRKKNGDIAIGNIIGSNIFNIFLVLGVTSLILQIPFSYGWNIDMLFLISATLLFISFIFIGKKKMLERWKGGVFLVLYLCYLAFLIIRG